jgi:peptide-methionine (R)-S-oxide reductase
VNRRANVNLMDTDTKREVALTDEQWRQRLTPEQYQVLRRQGTEAPFTGEYVDVKADGTYRCAGCGAELFDSDTKFESGTGWPSFYEPAVAKNVELHEDRSHGMVRTEVLCRSCGGHLGHVFDDGPAPTGLRYCINSCSLQLDQAGGDAHSE